MNERTSRRLRKICNPVDAVSKRVYRRLKKQYKQLPENAKNDFIDFLEKNFQTIQEVNLEQK